MPLEAVNRSTRAVLDTPGSKETGILEEVLPYPSDIRLSDDCSSLGMVPGLNPLGIDNFLGVTFPQSGGRVDSFDLFDPIIALLTADTLPLSARGATPTPDTLRYHGGDQRRDFSRWRELRN